MSFDAGAITSTLGIDVSPFAQGMLQANAIMSVFPQSVTNFLANPLLGLIGLAKDAAAALKNVFMSVGKAADDMGEAADRAGVSVEFLSTVGQVAKDSGSSVQGLGEALKFLGNNAADAAAGNEAAIKAFASIGVEFADASGKIKPAEQLFYQVADAIKGLESPALKTQAAMNLMGRGGTEMIPTLNQGSEAIKAMAADIEKLGGGFTTAEADAGDKFGKLTTLLEAGWAGVRKAFAAPILASLGENFDQAKETLMNFFGTVQKFVGSFMEAMAPVGRVLMEGFQVVMDSVAPLLQSLAPLIKGIADLVSGILGPAFDALRPILDALAAALKAIFDIVGPILSGIGSIVRGISEAIGLSKPEAEKEAARAKAAAAKKASVNIEKIQVEAIDTAEASSQIAGKIRAPIQQAIRRQTMQLDAAGKAELVLRNL